MQYAESKPPLKDGQVPLASQHEPISRVPLGGWTTGVPVAAVGAELIEHRSQARYSSAVDKLRA